MHEHAVERDRVEQRRGVVGPALDRVLLAWVVGSAVAARVEGEELEALPEPVVYEPEVVAAEEAAAELQDHRTVLGPRQLVVEGDCVRLGVGHVLLLG